MPRVYTQTKSNRGRERQCGRCGHTISPGEKYYKWSFRYGGTYYGCQEHYPRQSELTQSRMSEVYAAIESAEETIRAADAVEDIRQAVADVAEVAQGVADEYREAAEPFGGVGDNADRAAELEGWVPDLEGFEPDEPHSGDDGRKQVVEDSMRRDGFDPEDEAEWTSVFEARMADAEDVTDHDDDGDAIQAVRDEAMDLLGGCPL